MGFGIEKSVEIENIKTFLDLRCKYSIDKSSSLQPEKILDQIELEFTKNTITFTKKQRF